MVLNAESQSFPAELVSPLEQSDCGLPADSVDGIYNILEQKVEYLRQDRAFLLRDVVFEIVGGNTHSYAYEKNEENCDDE